MAIISSSLPTCPCSKNTYFEKEICTAQNEEHNFTKFNPVHMYLRIYNVS